MSAGIGRTFLLAYILTKNQLYVAEETAGTIVTGYYMGCFFNARSFNNPAASINSQKMVLGQQIFFDEGLSNPVGQSCATCHRPDAGFSDPSHLPASAGAITTRIGLRNSPSITYSAFTPSFHYNNNDSVYVGGLFLDGRASTLAEQAKHPFLNSAK